MTGVVSELVTGVGVFSLLFGGYPHCSSSSFKLVEVSIFSGCSSSEWCFSFFFFCLAGDDSVDACSLDVTAAVVASVIASVVVVVASTAASVVVTLFLRGAFLPFTDYLGSPLPFVGMVPRLQIWLAWWGCCYCCCCGFGCILKAGSCKMAYLFVGPTEGPPALNDHHYILILIGYDMNDGLEALPI